MAGVKLKEQICVLLARKEVKMTAGMLMRYGGAAGVVLGIVLMLVLSKIFAKQKSRMRDEIGGRK